MQGSRQVLTRFDNDDRPGVMLRARILKALRAARDDLVPAKAPLAGRARSAADHVRRARAFFRVWKPALGDAYEPRAARLKATSRALKALWKREAAKNELRLVSGGEAAPLPQDPGDDVLEIDGLLRRCEADAVSLAPGLVDHDALYEALQRAHRKARKRMHQTTGEVSDTVMHDWAEAVAQHLDLLHVATPCLGQVSRDYLASLQRLYAALQEIQRLEVVRRRLSSTGSVEDAVQKVDDERMRLWHGILQDSSSLYDKKRFPRSLLSAPADKTA